jgi:ribonuclease J
VGRFDVLEQDLSQWLGRSKAAVLKDDGKLNDGLKRVVRQSSQDEIGKKPEVTVVVSRLS